MEQIVESVKQNRSKIDKRQQEEKSKRDVLNTQLTQLIEKARQYAKLLKDFQEVNSFFNWFIFSNSFISQAIRENETLTSKSK